MQNFITRAQRNTMEVDELYRRVKGICDRLVGQQPEQKTPGLSAAERMPLLTELDSALGSCYGNIQMLASELSRLENALDLNNAVDSPMNSIGRY